jgi:methionyl-tRNA formyltransferase
MKVLFLHKKSDERAGKALKFVRQSGADVTEASGVWGDPFPYELQFWEGDLIVSYLSRWVLTEAMLARAPRAINFHPAPPERPGVGGTNWALYEGAEDFGVTAHLMAPRVDSGPIIARERFAVFGGDTVATLSERAWDVMLGMFYKVMSDELRGVEAPPLRVKWSGDKRTRAQLNALATVTPDMVPAEIKRRSRATTYGEFMPVMMIGDARLRVDMTNSS